MNQYIVSIDYTKFVFDEGEAALSFAEVARRHINNRKADITIVIEEGEEGGR